MMRKDKLDELPADLREVFQSTADRAHDLLNKTIRKDDQKAYDVVIKKGIQPVEADDAWPEWQAADKKVRDNLTGRMFSKSLVDSVAAAAVP
jgi:TRAP-type C4-dicarboxylate transport system substrate-binding protein